MRVAIVNDMTLAVEALRRTLTTVPEHEIAWIARDGEEAVRLSAQDEPDIILMDLIMPKMDGVEATRRIMAANPCAVLVVTATMDGNVAQVYEALGAGALDAVKTPVLGSAGKPEGAAALLAKITMIGKLTRDIRPEKNTAQAPLAEQAKATRPPAGLVAIGASAGGPAALAAVLAGLPANFPAAIVVVQHLDAQFSAGLAEWLARQTSLSIRLAVEGDQPMAGTVLVAGTNDHLVFLNPHTVGYSPEPRDYSYRPSINAFFESVVRQWRGEVLGVLLTGMGRDGATGLKSLRDAGHHTIAQDKETSAVYGMPKAAAQAGAAVEILPLDEIAPVLVRRFQPRPEINHSKIKSYSL